MNPPEQKAAQPEVCPRCGSSCRSSRWCTIRHPNGMHLDHDEDCKTCRHKWHDALPVEPPATVQCNCPTKVWIGDEMSESMCEIDHDAAKSAPGVQPAQIQEGFQVNIVCHTADAQQRMSDPENVRFKIGEALDALRLQEEVDYTLEVRRTYESK